MLRCWAARNPKRAPKMPKMAPEAFADTRCGWTATLASDPPRPEMT